MTVRESRRGSLTDREEKGNPQDADTRDEIDARNREPITLFLDITSDLRYLDCAIVRTNCLENFIATERYVRESFSIFTASFFQGTWFRTD